MALLNDEQLALFALILEGGGVDPEATDGMPLAGAANGAAAHAGGLDDVGGANVTDGGLAAVIIQIRNDSGAPLSLKLQSADGGQFVSAPPASVPVDGTGEFRFAGVAGASEARGALQWSVGDSGVTWFIEWRRLAQGGGTSQMSISPDQPGLGMDSQVGSDKPGVPMSFTLFRRDGPSPTVLSCTVVVANQSLMPLTLRGKSTGGLASFATEPPGTLLPGSQGSFQCIGEPGAPSLSGAVSWDLGDTGSTWNVGWTLSPRDGNSADGNTSPPRPGFAVEAVSQPGTSQVPVKFILLGNEPPSRRTVNTLVEIRNDSGVPLSLQSVTSTGAQFVGGPPATVAIGGNARFELAGVPGVGVTQAALEWLVGDTGEVWAIDWVLPVEGGGSSKTRLSSDGLDMGMDGGIGQGRPDVPATFTLFSRKSPGPPLSATILVRNASKLPLTLRGKSTGGNGKFASEPAGMLKPGDSTQFQYVGDAGAPGMTGSLVWNVGDSGSTWANGWTVAPRDGNTAGTTLNPPLPGTASGATIDRDLAVGVPVKFELEGGEAPTSPPMSAIINIHNDSGMPLTLKSQSVLGGQFVSAPPATVADGVTARLHYAGVAGVLAATGALEWSVGDSGAIWSMDWKLSQHEGSSAVSKFGPEQPGITFTSDMGTGTTDVPLDFTLAAKAKPVPPVPPDPPDDDFAPPPESRQPTLHKGDQSPDGWVEYAQRLLIKHKLDVSVNGNFDAAMEKQVRLFQQQQGCQVDGVIGNQTWSMLREAPKKEAVGTDGRPAHSFEQTDAQARFLTERPDATGYVAADDRYFMLLVSVGEQSIEGQQVTVKVTQPDQTAHTHKEPIGAPSERSPDGQGNLHKLEISKFRKTFKIPDGVDPLDCTVDAYLDASLGGDRFTGPVTAG